MKRSVLDFRLIYGYLIYSLQQGFDPDSYHIDAVEVLRGGMRNKDVGE